MGGCWLIDERLGLCLLVRVGADAEASCRCHVACAVPLFVCPCARVCEMRPGCCPDGESQTGDGCDGIGSVSDRVERQARTHGQVLQACVASGSMFWDLIARHVLRRPPCGPGASLAVRRVRAWRSLLLRFRTQLQ